MLAVERLRKVNALTGFTRIDALDRVGDVPGRLVPLTRSPRPAWTVATEDRGEGIFLQFDEERVASWEDRVLSSELWQAHRDAHRRNFYRRFSETAEEVDPDSRLKPPRYWLVHTLAHVLIRQMAMTCGYSAASLSERLYAWPAADGRASGGGPADRHDRIRQRRHPRRPGPAQRATRLEQVVTTALDRATRCSSTRSARNARPRTRRISYTARRATAA